MLRYRGGGQRWADEVVRTRAAQPPADDHFRDLSAYTREDPAIIGPWLREGGGRGTGSADRAAAADPHEAAGPRQGHRDPGRCAAARLLAGAGRLRVTGPSCTGQIFRPAAPVLYGTGAQRRRRARGQPRNCSYAGSVRKSA
ncbi:hypothetical protein AB0M87_08130 [Streptomyces sp. NPDC051320]|uniref:hypothetical protein n=1 Tax=Streptomyces sp. NPDC051320 TaxID=3154644 RepID=UPI003437B4B3